ncbi:MAG: hypothetical protein OXI34_01470 [Chloroflexota bacterium]|nr:hypothetical protein [Chloroflexota bacterium]MDE2947435.1 hypothetical protein [Chloroflexota bacterium]
MADPEQVTRHEREIGELRGKLDALATKEFVRTVVNEQTRELNEKFDTINKKFDAMDQHLKDISDRQQRFKGIGQAISFGLPFLVSALALVAVLLK